MQRKGSRAERGPMLFFLFLVIPLALLISALPLVSFFAEDGVGLFTSRGDYLTGAVVSETGSGEGLVGILEDANSTECGYINSDLTLTANVNNRSTCFTINASN